MCGITQSSPQSAALSLPQGMVQSSPQSVVQSLPQSMAQSLPQDMDGSRPAARHDSERTARCDHWSATRHGPEPSSKSGSEPAREHVLGPPPGVAKSSPQGSAHKVSAWDLPHQLRRLIAGAVLAFGCDQGLFLRRQCPLRVLALCHISA